MNKEDVVLFLIYTELLRRWSLLAVRAGLPSSPELDILAAIPPQSINHVFEHLTEIAEVEQDTDKDSYNPLDTGWINLN